MSKGASGNKNGMWREVSIEQIIKMYTEGNMSLTAIAKELGCDRGTVKRRLEYNNIPLEKKPRSDKSVDNTPAKNKLFYKYRMQANRRNIEFKLKYKDFLEIIEKYCFYCGSPSSNTEITPSGHILKYNGIDRIDNAKGYVDNNVVPCCKICNQMKSNLGYDEFIEQIDKIHKHFKL